MLLQCTNKAFRTAVAFGFADKGGRTGDAHKGQFLLKHMRHLLTAMIMPEHQAPGDLRPTCSKGGTDPLTDGLQRCKPGSLLGRMDTHTLRRIMIHCDKDRHLP